MKTEEKIKIIANAMLEKEQYGQLCPATIRHLTEIKNNREREKIKKVKFPDIKGMCAKCPEKNCDVRNESICNCSIYNRKHRR